jgi:PAS domain S-box-containing protein
MTELSCRILLIEDNPADAVLFRERLADAAGGPYEVVCVESLADGLVELGQRPIPFDIVVVDLTLPDSAGLPTFHQIYEAAGQLPVVISSGLHDEDLAVRAVQAGAEDYLDKDQSDPFWLGRSIRHAIERRRLREAIKKSNERFHQLVEQASDAFFIIDSENYVVDMNRQACESLGYERNDMLAMPFVDIDPNFNGENVTQIWEQISEGEAVTRKSKHIRSDGTSFPVEIRIGLFELHGRFALALVRDVSDRARLLIREGEFRVAQDIQQRLFPKQSPKNEVFDIAGLANPADETGGDYFDFLPLANNRWGIAIGDVSGHGIGPALLMAQTHAFMRAFSQTDEDIEGVLTKVNRALVETTHQHRLITLFYVRLDPEQRMFEFVAAGHRAHLSHPDGTVDTLITKGIPLAIDRDAAFPASKPQPFQTGQILIMATDGLSEAVDSTDQQFGDERINDTVHRHRDLPAREIVENVFEEVRQFSDGRPQLDDMTLVIVKDKR